MIFVAKILQRSRNDYNEYIRRQMCTDHHLFPRWLRNHFRSCFRVSSNDEEHRFLRALHARHCMAIISGHSMSLTGYKTRFAHNAVAIEIIRHRRIARAGMINVWETFLRTDAALGRDRRQGLSNRLTTWNIWLYAPF